VEGRIKELEILLATARVISDTGQAGSIQVGAKVTIQEGKNSPEVYTIVGAAEANPRAGRISNESPLGRSLLNRVPGDIVHVDAPAGGFEVKVVKVE
jgi:transcription elongation factor GreA